MRFRFVEDQEVTLFAAIPVGLLAGIVTTLFKEALEASGLVMFGKDADIVLTDGWIRHYKKQFTETLPKIAMEGYGPDTLAWLADHPEWDPRVRLAPPALRGQVQRQIAKNALLPYAGHPLFSADSSILGDQEYDGLNRPSQVNGLCMAADGLAMEVAMARMTFDILGGLSQDPPAAPAPAAGEKKPEALEGVLDGLEHQKGQIGRAHV